MVAGASGTHGVSVPSQLVVYKQGKENVLIQNHYTCMVGNTAMGPEHCSEDVPTRPVAMKVTYKILRCDFGGRRVFYKNKMNKYTNRN